MGAIKYKASVCNGGTAGSLLKDLATIIFIFWAKRLDSGIYPSHLCRLFLLFFRFILALTRWDELDWPSHDRPLCDLPPRGTVCVGQSG